MERAIARERQNVKRKQWRSLAIKHEHEQWSGERHQAARAACKGRAPDGATFLILFFLIL
jgi:hypothetical protein